MGSDRPDRVPELPPRLAYDLWAASYAAASDDAAGAGNPVAAAAARTLRSLLDLLDGLAAASSVKDMSEPPNVIRGREVLDVACGTGRWLSWLSAAGARQVIGVDRSGAMATRAHALGGSVSVADMRALPFAPVSFDLVLHVLALGHVPDPATAIGECARVLRPGGWLVLVDLHPNFTRLGWQRTFRSAAGDLLAVRWWPHAPEHMIDLCQQAGLAVPAHSLATPWHGECLDPEQLPPRGGRLPPDMPIVYGLAVGRPAARRESVGIASGKTP